MARFIDGHRRLLRDLAKALDITKPVRSITINASNDAFSTATVVFLPDKDTMDEVTQVILLADKKPLESTPGETS